MSSTAAVTIRASPIAGPRSGARLFCGQDVPALAHAVVDDRAVPSVTIERSGAGENLRPIRTGESRAKGRVGTDIATAGSSNVAVDVGIAVDLRIGLLAAGLEI